MFLACWERAETGIGASFDAALPENPVKAKPYGWLGFLSGLGNYFEGMIAHATYDISDAKIEGINNKIKTLRRQGY